MRSPASKLLAVPLGLVLVFAACGKKPSEAAAPGGAKAEAKTLTIAVIPKGTTHEFWKAIHAGAVRASREIGVEIIWKGPQKEDDRAQQITVVEDFISRGVDGIVLAPLDDRALMRPVGDAMRDKIPVVIIDSALQGSDYVSYVATDNYQGGVLAARRLGQLLGGRGRIFLIRYQEGSASTVQREAGFYDTVQKEFPGLTLLVQDQYAGATTETAYQLAENLISRFPDVQGIFTPNESSTFGTLRALQESRLAGKVVFVGFDSSPKLVQGLRDGDIMGLVLQNPEKMGYLGVKTIVAHLRGEPVEKVIDTGVVMVTADNMDVPEIKALLSPDLSLIKD
ncbi:MAG TPA: substrate-binding domain-containing protein [Acidobacteriota bacterium]|nr:substrate-binding domain-containing protein [Acidobacteriota bacterium]